MNAKVKFLFSKAIDCTVLSYNFNSVFVLLALSFLLNNVTEFTLRFIIETLLGG